ncbi:MAG: acetate--CoA ligase family protein [Bacteroidetes bacterium]|nr:acetate--CoA ligase family protein [Bacteroidota bacterium]
MEENNYINKLEKSKRLIEELKEQFERENQKILEYKKEIYRTKDFSISRFYTYSGPNYYLDRQAVVFNIFIAPIGDSVDYYREKAIEIFPALEHIDTPYVIDLFAEVLILTLKMEIDLYINKYSISKDKDEYVVAVEYLDEDITIDAIELVSDWFRAISNDEEFDFRGEFEKLQQVFDKTPFGGPTLYSLIEAGLKRDIPVFHLIEENQFQWGYGKKQLRGRSTTFQKDGIKDTEFTMYKDMVGEFLEMCGFPTPNGINCFEEEEIVEEALKIGFPVVVKPVAGHKGQGVTTNITTEEEVRKSFKSIVSAAAELGVNFDGALVQKMIHGNDHRLLAVGGKCVAALKRVPAFVEGNGHMNIEQLINEENDKLIRLDNARSPLCKIKIDENLIEFIDQQGLALSSVPEPGQKITLRKVANISAGGVSYNVTNEMHPDNIALVEDIASYFQLTCLGIDVLAADISKSWRDGDFGIIEINAGPGVFMHLAPAYGESIDVPALIMKSHFGENFNSRIPIIAANKVSNNLIDLINNKLHEMRNGIFFGALNETGVFMNGRYFHNNQDHCQNVKLILRHPKTDIALFCHDAEKIHDYGIFHKGADLLILDHADHYEKAVLKEQLIGTGYVLEIENNEINLLKGGESVSVNYFFTPEEKDQRIMDILSEHLNHIISLY